MKERPILFSGPMVRAILEGRKSVTRRVVKPKYQPFIDNLLKKFLGDEWGNRPLPYKKGDHLWVRETWSPSFGGAATDFIWYRATPDKGRFMLEDGTWVDQPIDAEYCGGWRPSIFMPRWASRITLEVTGVRVERLQEISEEDINAEGAITTDWLDWREDALTIALPEGSHVENEHDVFAKLWDSINAKTYPWSSNPWTWCIYFRRI